MKLAGLMQKWNISFCKIPFRIVFEQFLCIRLNNHMYTTGEGAAYEYKGSASDIDVSKLNYEIDYIRLSQKDNGEINLK